MMTNDLNNDLYLIESNCNYKDNNADFAIINYTTLQTASRTVTFRLASHAGRENESESPYT